MKQVLELVPNFRVENLSFHVHSHAILQKLVNFSEITVLKLSLSKMKLPYTMNVFYPRSLRTLRLDYFFDELHSNFL